MTEHTSDNNPDPRRQGDDIPLSPSEREPKPKITRESLLAMGKDAKDTCPSCGAELPDPDAIVCLECGFDMKSNRKVRTKVGVEEVDEEAGGDFCRASKIPWQALAIGGGLCIVGASVLAVMQAERAPAMALLRVLVHSLVHVGLGVVAVIVAAVMMRQRVGKVEHVVGWMSLAVGGFALLVHLAGQLNAHIAVQTMLGGALAAGFYYLVVWLGVVRTHVAAALVAGLQFSFWLLLKVYASLSAAGATEALSGATG